MDDLYTIPVNSDPKHGLGLSTTDLDTYQFPTICGELDHDQLLTLDDPQSFYLAFPDVGLFGTCDEAFSRASSAVTPASECSTRTSLSARNISPTSDIMSFQDQPTPQDIEAMYHDTTQSIISGRQVRAASATWPSANSMQIGLNSTLTPPARTLPLRPQSFSYRTPQMSTQDGQTPPPPPSTFFAGPSPGLQPQAAARSPFLSPNMISPSPISPNGHSPLAQHVQQISLSPQAAFVPVTMSANPSSYYAQPQSQPPPPSHLQQQMQNSNTVIQRQLQLQQQALSLHHPFPQRRSLSGPIPMQGQLGAGLYSNTQFPPQPSNSLYPPGNNISQNVNVNAATPTLPNTTGNSSTGYQCFSHGCGGRHFSNWGNLVRHHRERQLRSKAGAKPTCPRCGKGFTRSSARDAHVTGLKCVLGRRRRGATATSTASGTSSGGVQTSNSSDAQGRDRGAKDSESTMDDDQEHDIDNASEGSREDGVDVDFEDEDDLDALSMSKAEVEEDHDEANDDGLMMMVEDPLGLSSDVGQSYLAPQQLQFD